MIGWPQRNGNRPFGGSRGCSRYGRLLSVATGLERPLLLLDRIQQAFDAQHNRMVAKALTQ